MFQRIGVITFAIALFLMSASTGSGQVLPDRECQGVPATGQTGCWDQFGNRIECAGTGQDGEYQIGFTTGAFPRFTDNHDGTVTDNLTGLVWLQHASCLGFMQWKDAIATAETLADGACGLMDGSVAGDWRLPNVREMQSLIDYNNDLPALPPGNPFGSTSIGHPYWTSTTFVFGEAHAWMVILAVGITDAEQKNQQRGVLPVRDH